MSDKKNLEDILRHLYVTAVQDADGVRADRKGYHMRYDEVPARAKQAIEALITQQRQELIDEIKNAMGKPKEVDPIGDPFYLEYKGYNLAIEKLTRSLNKLEESDDQ